MSEIELIDDLCDYLQAKCHSRQRSVEEIPSLHIRLHLAGKEGRPSGGRAGQ
jgi:hypothetical protein